MVSARLLPGLLFLCLELVVDGFVPRWKGQQQQLLLLRHRPTCRSSRRVVRASVENFLDVLSDEVVKESANAASNVGKLGWEGAKLAWKGATIAAPVVGQGVKSAVDTLSPMVQDGIETAAPVVKGALRDGFDAAAPVMAGARDEMIAYATPAAEAAADKALASIQPYLDSGRRVPEALLSRAETLAGEQRVAAAFDAARVTQKGVASALRGAAGLLDGGEGVGQSITSEPGIAGGGGGGGAVNGLRSLGKPPTMGATTAASGNGVGSGGVVRPLFGGAGRNARDLADAGRGVLGGGGNGGGGYVKAIESSLEAQKKAAMAPLVKLENDLVTSAEQFAAATAVGVVGLAAVRRFVRPLEEFAQRVLLAAVAVGSIYFAATYGPKAAAVYHILNDEAVQLEKAVR